ncbi:hypothetical protein [Stratiformator vulcanicus]|uniref:hypothetical protein n=1 Tax=Stratiformator vulcanicus TaxID=2527980 RepID=UPI0011A11DFA|nr:hypothetical protein [Stratiformator vulcanicus]
MDEIFPGVFGSVAGTDSRKEASFGFSINAYKARGEVSDWVKSASDDTFGTRLYVAKAGETIPILDYSYRVDLISGGGANNYLKISRTEGNGEALPPGQYALPAYAEIDFVGGLGGSLISPEKIENNHRVELRILHPVPGGVRDYSKYRVVTDFRIGDQITFAKRGEVVRRLKIKDIVPDSEERRGYVLIERIKGE